jgi:hypothetical protein
VDCAPVNSQLLAPSFLISACDPDSSPLLLSEFLSVSSPEAFLLLLPLGLGFHQKCLGFRVEQNDISVIAGNNSCVLINFSISVFTVKRFSG